MKNKKYPYYLVAEPTDLKDLLSFCAKEYDSKTAFCYKASGEEIKVSFKQLYDDVSAFCLHLYSKGCKNAHIALMGENSYEWIVAYFAIVCSGNVVVPIDKELTLAEVKLQLEKSDTDIFIHSDRYKDIAGCCGVECINMQLFSDLIEKGKCILKKNDNKFMDSVIDNEKLCAIVFTSGTTAEPKGVMLNHKNLVKDLIISSKNLWLPGETVAILPFFHTYGFMASVLCPMLKGYSVYINTNIKRVFGDIKYAKPKYIAVVPMILVAIYDKIWTNVRNQGKEKLFAALIKISNFLLNFGIDIRKIVFKEVIEAFGGNLEMIISGGAQTDAKYVEFFKSIGIKVTNGYGITECSPIVTTMRNKHYAPSSVGTVNPEIELRIVDDEIQVKGPVVFMGYFKDNKATEEAFDKEWFRTGDLGYIKDNFLYITGRKKNLIILSNGKNVVPEELESLIRNIREVKEVLVSGKNNVITAEILPDTEVKNVECIIKEKIDKLNANLPLYKQISSVEFRNTEFLKTTTKKIKRNYGES